MKFIYLLLRISFRDLWLDRGKIIIHNNKKESGNRPDPENKIRYKTGISMALAQDMICMYRVSVSVIRSRQI